MVDVGIGALGYFGYAKEASEGTTTAPAKFLPVTSINFNDSNDYLTPLTIRQNRDTSVAMPAPFIIQGTVELPLVSDDIALLLKSAFVANVTTSAYTGGSATSAYQHVYTLSDSATQSTMSVETATPGNLLVNRYLGNRVNTFELRGSFGEIVTASVGFDGINRATPTNSSAASPSYAANSVTPFHFSGATVSGVNYVQNFTLGVNNNVEHIGQLAGTRAYSRVALGQREITLTMTCDFQSYSEYLAMANDSEVSNLAITLVGPSIGGTALSSLSLTIPRMKYRNIGVPINATDFVTQDIEFTVLKSTSAQIITSLQLTNRENASHMTGSANTGTW